MLVSERVGTLRFFSWLGYSFESMGRHVSYPGTPEPYTRCLGEGSDIIILHIYGHLGDFDAAPNSS